MVPLLVVTPRRRGGEGDHDGSSAMRSRSAIGSPRASPKMARALASQ
jgi:hypothetical protein